ncbi:ABC transporter permease [Vibrio sp. TRT 21S02]|uniref:ABC transporter permease n=1 Tax=Vibrio sp. TRT 21S02 TaxID=3418507 RepID=UPI003CED5CA7
MNSVVDISWTSLGFFFLALLVPFSISRYLKLQLEKDIIISVVRMTVQLILVGLYLEYLFTLNSLVVNLAWLMFMVLVGASSVIGKASLPKARLFLPVSAGLSLSLLPVLGSIILLIVQPQPFYSAQYMIPLAGMLLGNSLSGNIVALQNLFTSFQERKSEYEAAIALGASAHYACLPFIRSAIQKSLAPTLASMSTMGLVTLPGMMTGQILGGASPIIAIKYQAMIMIAIFVMMSLSTTISLTLAVRNCINPYGKILVSLKSE